MRPPHDSWMAWPSKRRSVIEERGMAMHFLVVERRVSAERGRRGVIVCALSSTRRTHQRRARYAAVAARPAPAPEASGGGAPHGASRGTAAQAEPCGGTRWGGAGDAEPSGASIRCPLSAHDCVCNDDADATEGERRGACSTCPLRRTSSQQSRVL